MSIEAPFVLLADTDVVLTLVEYDEAHQGVARATVGGLHEGVVVVVVDHADLDAAEVVAHVSVAHPEETLLVIVAALALDFGCPELGGVGPIAVPLEVAPGVSEEAKANSCALLVSYFNNFEKAVTVLCN